MNPPPQRTVTGGAAPHRWNLPLNQRTVLVTTDVLRAVRGVDAEVIHAAVDDFRLRWVFNIAVDPAKARELRFWAKEVIAPEFTRTLSFAAALQEILGENRTRWRGAEIQQLLLISRPTIMRLHHHGDLPGKVVRGTFWTARPAVENFLRTRWVSAPLVFKRGNS
jgi:hypothetical protein